MINAIIEVWHSRFLAPRVRRSFNDRSDFTLAGIGAGCLWIVLLNVFALVARADAADGRLLRIDDGKDWLFVTDGDVQVKWRDSDKGIDPTTEAPWRRRRAFYTKQAFSDVTLSFKLNLRYNAQGAGRAGAILRARDSNHFYLVYFPHTAQVYRAKNFWVGVAKVEGDEYIRNIKLARVPNVPAETDRWYDVRVEAKGNRISVRVDGRNVLSVADDTYQSGLVGLAGQGLFYVSDMTVDGKAMPAAPWARSAKIQDSSFRFDLPSNIPPSGCVAPNGDVLIGAGRFLMRSKDKGRTWSKTTLPEGMSISDSGKSMIRMPDDTLKVFRKKDRSDAPAPDIMEFVSADNGLTWSGGAPAKVLGNWYDHYDKRANYIVPYGSVVRCDDGTLILFFFYDARQGAGTLDPPQTKIAGLDLTVDTWGRSACKGFAIRSTDDGRTWSAPIEIDQPRSGYKDYDKFNVPRGSISGAMDLTEITGVAIGNKIMAVVRPIYNPYMWQCWSYDSGKTWDAASSTTFPGYAESMIRLKSGVIVCAHRFPNYSVNISGDDGANWDEGTIVADSLWGMGCLVEVEPNVVLCVYMEDQLDPKANLLGQFFRVTPKGIAPISLSSGE